MSESGPACCGATWSVAHSDECYRAGRDAGRLEAQEVIRRYIDELEGYSLEMGEELPEGEVLAAVAERLRELLGEQ